MKRHLIIGNGGAAFNAILAIRSLRPEDKITVVSPEDCPAYSPMLTPYYIAGSIPYSSMFLCKSGFYRKHHVKTILGRAVVAVEPESQRVCLDDDRKLDYDELLIATGSSPNAPMIPGMDLGLTLWTVRDARRLKVALYRANSVAVVGAGLIGLQIVDMALKMEKKVALIEIKDRVLPRVMDKEGAAIIAERLLAKGINLHLGTRLNEVMKGKGNKILRLKPGGKLEADLVIFATGVYPNRQVVARSPINVDNGIMVDEFGQTNKEHIFAAGDVAQ
ncbi:MAG: NAD(P)/FAD-dependent oxidoreductase, partial [Dehalococcoidia bacterium]|nr:NAD(P)/FAD-dependent oxidoreductase [Dehalococcoidia bacterium]